MEGCAESLYQSCLCTIAGCSRILLTLTLVARRHRIYRDAAVLSLSSKVAKSFDCHRQKFMSEQESDCDSCSLLKADS